MMNYSVLSRALLMLALMASMISCSKDGNGGTELPKNYKYLKEVITERKINKANIIAELDRAFPELNIASSSLVSQIKDIEVAAITYTTTGVDEKPILASGLIAMTAGTTTYDHLLSIQHGTLDLEEAPSHRLFYYEMAPVVSNHVVVMADYLGYGVSQTTDRQHPYLHNESTGRTCADMIEAAREYLADKRITETANKVELIGYSQGATSTISTVYELEKRGQESRIRGVHAGGGPYDLANTISAFIAAGITGYPRMGYLPYIFRGISYGEQLMLDNAKIYSPSLIENGGIEMFATKPLSQWHEPLGPDVRNILNSDFLAPPTYNGNTDILKLLAAVEKNSLINLNEAKTPIKLYHSRTDDFVFYSNAVAAKHKWSNATLTDLTSAGHLQAGMEFMLRYMGLWGMMTPKQ